MQDIATALGISKNAVHLALSNKPGISESLRSKVIQTAISMNYGGYGKLGSALERNLITICVPSAISGFSQFYSSVYWAVEQELGTHGYRSLLTSVTEDMEKSLTLPPVLYEREVKGVIVVGILSKEYVRKMAEVFESIILVDNYYVDLALNSVATANMEGGYEATKYLIGQGCHQIGFVGQIHKYNAYNERCLGYKLALSDAGLPVRNARLCTDVQLFTPEIKLDEIVDCIKRESMDAVFCACDREAIQLIGKLHAEGINIPGDISIIGFDDIENADIVNPPLTTMRVPRRELGRRAAGLLIDRLESKAGPPSAVSIFPQLIQRNSVRAKND